jgi:hypothetical protein
MPELKGVIDVTAAILEVVLVAAVLLWSDSRSRARDPQT